MNQIWVSRRSLTNSASETIDLDGGVTNSFGTQLDFAEVRLVFISAASTNTAALNVGGAAANAFSTWLGDASDVVSIRPGGVLMVVGPDDTAYTVSTNGNLKIQNGGTGNATYDIYIGGSDQ